MRVVFMGTPAFAAPSLEALHEHHEVIAVVTRPDAVRSRGKKTEPSPVKRKALELGIERIIETKTLSPIEIQQELVVLQPDVIVVAAFGALLPPEILDLPRFGCINVHASLLPRWRGAAPVQRTILAKDSKAGISIMRMAEGMDTGDFTNQRETLVAKKTAEELFEELAQLGSEALIETLNQIETGSVTWHVQHEHEVTHAAKIEKEEMRLDPQLDADDNLCKVLASSDQAPARATILGRGVRVVHAQAICDEDSACHATACPGEVLIAHKNRLLLCCDNGSKFEILALKPDGKATMDASAWLGGIRDAEFMWERI